MTDPQDLLIQPADPGAALAAAGPGTTAPVEDSRSERSRSLGRLPKRLAAALSGKPRVVPGPIQEVSHAVAG